MAMLNRSLTPREMSDMIRREWIVPLSNKLFELITEPRYQCVQYDAAAPRVAYEQPNTFYGYGLEPSPSDCVWMVPNLPPISRL